MWDSGARDGTDRPTPRPFWLKASKGAAVRTQAPLGYSLIGAANFLETPEPALPITERRIERSPTDLKQLMCLAM